MACITRWNVEVADLLVVSNRAFCRSSTRHTVRFDVGQCYHECHHSLYLFFSQETAVPAPEVDGMSGDAADGAPAAVCEYGICMVDSTTATFSLGQFADDPARSRLRTLLAQQLPVEILMEKVR